MSEMSRSILDSVVSWHDRNRAKLASLGVEVRLVGPTVGRSKNSATVEFISPQCLVAATIWDSGECEIITTFVQGDDDPSVTVHDMADFAAVISLLDGIVLELTGRPK